MFFPLSNGAKSVQICQQCQSYSQKQSGTFFMAHSVYIDGSQKESCRARRWEKMSFKMRVEDRKGELNNVAKNTHFSRLRLRLTVRHLLKLLTIDTQVGTTEQWKVNVWVAMPIHTKYHCSLVSRRLSLYCIRQWLLTLLHNSRQFTNVTEYIRPT